MEFRRYTPGWPLAQFVDFMWFYDGYDPLHHKERMLPDGTMELVIDLRDQPKRLFDREDYQRRQTFTGGWISGKQTRHIVIEAAPGSSMMGVHFKPEGTFPFLQFPVSELTDQVIPMDLIWGRDARLWREQLLEAATVERKFLILEHYLLHLGGDALTAQRSVARAIDLLMRSPQGMAVRELAGLIGITQKHLITQFDKFVGLKPKLFGRICRFQRVLTTVEQIPRVEWAPLAAGCGYYDQSHFIREFQSFTGLSPSRYLYDKGDYPNFVPIRDGDESPDDANR